MEARYERNIPALTEVECALLRGMRVLVVGCGGLGGNLISIFSRIGVGNLRIVDGDVFEATNLNRQLFALHSTVGLPKTEAAKRRVLDINPADFNDPAVITLAKLLYIATEMTAYVQDQVALKSAGEPYDTEAFDPATGEPLTFR